LSETKRKKKIRGEAVGSGKEKRERNRKERKWMG
jgi:hypothetical protein